MVFVLIGGAFVRNPTIGLMQASGRCTTNSFHYTVQNIPTIANSSSVHVPHPTNPIIYDEDNNSCIDDQHLSFCYPLRDGATSGIFQQSSDLFAKIFSLENGFIFPYFFSIVFISLLYAILIVEAVYDGPDTVSDAQTKRYLAYFSKCIGFLLVYLMYLSISTAHILFKVSCDSVMIDLDEAAVFCRILKACDLTLASIYSTNWTPLYGYREIMYYIGWWLGILTTIHLVLSLIYDTHCILVERSEARRVAIVNLRGDELNLALETASVEFIEYYLIDWTWAKKSAPSSRALVYGLAAPAVYSPLPTSDRTLPPTPVPDIKQDDGHCTVCQDILFTADSGKKVIELQCHHTFHQTCILQYMLTAATNAESECPTCK